MEQTSGEKALWGKYDPDSGRECLEFSEPVKITSPVLSSAPSAWQQLSALQQLQAQQMNASAQHQQLCGLQHNTASVLSGLLGGFGAGLIR